MGLKLNYALAYPLAAACGRRGGDQRCAGAASIVRSGITEYRQRKNLTVYLATPPRSAVRETVQLKLQIHSLHGIKALHWQGDTRALSLTRRR